MTPHTEEQGQEYYMSDNHEQVQARLMARAMNEHLQDPHPGLDGPRLRVHVATHTVVETQIARDAPPETAQTLQRLMAEGLSRHDAVHAIGTVISEQLINAVGQKSAYDEERYITRLSELRAKDLDPERTTP